ncbi:uncharacterized protein LOC134231013 [Saccostrea cucullata]|uniref:uncharacterized protein LOC134231013 n=1 Tax=Saccostrea cuccullata TaxID=36930 RepID=UPI002ECFFE93
MEKTRRISVDRKGIQSLFIPAVPKIVFETSEPHGPETTGGTIPHSHSAGELAIANEGNQLQKRTGSTNFPSSDGSESSSRSTLDLYCSPRLQRRQVFQFDQDDMEQSWTETMVSRKSSNTLGPGNKIGSTLSLTSECTARSIGLISNDSSSDSTQFSDKLEHIKQKQNYLRRYASNPEKNQKECVENAVQRSTKSFSNFQSESQRTSEVGSDSMDDSLGDYVTPREVQEQMSRFSVANSNENSSPNLITMVTDDSEMKEGRIRQWLTDIDDKDGSFY